MTCQSYPPPTRKCMKLIYARQIFDSKGVPTIEVDLITDLGLFRASIPSANSQGPYESVEIRDGNNKDYSGKGVCKVVHNINSIIGPELLKQELDVTEQEKVDQFLKDLDGTENKSKFGANALLGVSLAVCKAGAAKRGLPLYRHLADLAGIKTVVLPVPVFSVMMGGRASSNKLPYKEYTILPTGATSFAEAMKMGTETYHSLAKILQRKYGTNATTVGDAGGFATANIKNPKEALQFIVRAIQAAGYTGRVQIGMDAAASKFLVRGHYALDFKNKKKNPKNRKKPGDMLKIYTNMVNTYHIVSLQDPYGKEDMRSWANISNRLKIQIVGNELTASNPQRIMTAVHEKACNAFLLNLSQIGTVTEAIKIHLLAQENNLGTVICHCDGETEDTFEADFAVGLSNGQVIFGAPCAEHLSRYNQILRIEEELGKEVRYAGQAFRRPL
ncbi:enolase-like [Diabrotica virgifera virgifera]|uniref:Enolase n=1 Tax=Diabrotica virgifera virgifera TaxID=50390 RepID=A0A6P7GCC2_DIAVI|nr:enolase-like [Diabrotica virgifera virgifera]